MNMIQLSGSKSSRLGCALLLGACLASCTNAGQSGGPVITHTAITATQFAGLPVAIEAKVTATAGVASVSVYYESPGGAWKDVALTAGTGGSYSGQIPGADVTGTSMSYYLAATDAKGATATLPTGAPTHFYSFPVSVPGDGGAPSPDGGDNDGPMISFAKIADGRPVGTAVPIQAAVSDPSGVASVYVYYRTRADDGGVTGDWQSLPMTLQSTGQNLYAATLPNAAVVPPAVEYYLEATDNDSPTPHTSTLPKGAPDSAAPFSFTVSPGDVDPPVITHTPVANGQPAGRDVGIAASVTDATGVAYVSVFYRVTGTTTWTPLPMPLVSGANYAAAIPASAVTSAGVDYYLEAKDTAPMGNVAHDPTDAPTGFHSFTTQGETCVVPPLAAEDFPSTVLPGWWRTINGTGTGCGWQITSLASHSASYSMGHSYGDNCDDLLVLPCIDLSAPPADGVVLDFWQYELLPTVVQTHSLEYTFDNPDSTSPAPTWTVIDGTLPVEPVAGWVHRSVLIPPTSPVMGHGQVYLALRYVGNQADRWAVDDIGVRLTAPQIALASIATTPEAIVPGGASNVDVALTINLINTGDQTSTALTGVLSTTDSLVTITTNSGSFAAVSPGATVAADTFRLTVDKTHAVGAAALVLHVNELNQDIPIALYVGARATAHVQLTTSGGVGEADVDLYLGVGADPTNPTWISPRFNGTGPFGGTWSYDPDLTPQVAYLPPSLTSPWFLKVVDNYGTGSVMINQFSIGYGTATYTAINLPFIATQTTSYILLPTPPALAVDGSVTSPVAVTPGASNVSLTVTLRNDGAITSGPVTATIAPKDAATTAAVANLDLTTAHAFGSTPIGAGQKAAGTPWTFDVAATFTDGKPLNFVLTVTDGTLVWHLDVVVPVPWPGVTLLDWTTTSATTDFDFLPDPGESVGLSLLVQNSGTLATAGVVQGTLTWNAAGAPGSVTTTSALPFGSAALAPGATATASPFNIQVDPAAVPHTKILMDLALTDGTNSWNRALAIPLFYHLGTDTQGDGASGVDLQAAYFFCDNTDLIVRIASFGTFNPTSSGFSLVVADTSGNVYRLRAVNGVLSAQSWQASGWVAEAAPPASLAITPTSGTTAVITFQVKLADLTKLQLAGKAAKLAIESVDPYYLTIDDALPNGWDGADFTKLIAVTWP